MKKFTKAFAGALALITAVTAFTGCAGSATTSGDTANSSAASSAETEKQMSENAGVISAVDNVSASEDYKDIKVDTKTALGNIRPYTTRSWEICGKSWLSLLPTINRIQVLETR